MMILKTLACVTLLAAGAFCGSNTGKIQILEAFPKNNFPFRVTLANQTNLCGTNISWAFVSSSNDNYDVFVRTLLMAKSTYATVTLNTTKDATTGFCVIGSLSVTE